MERLLVSIPDILLAGGGAFLLFNNGKARWLGGPLILLYLLSLFGAYTGGNPPSLNAGNKEAGQFFSYFIGFIAFVMGAFFGWKRKKKRIATAAAD
ncbi:MAG TPA: hypothetical protein VEB42_16910 [Chitinophagaceae bacterium]|nr:hypothetical protein [Chitinophagaceae bacterium]